MGTHRRKSIWHRTQTRFGAMFVLSLSLAVVTVFMSPPSYAAGPTVQPLPYDAYAPHPDAQQPKRGEQKKPLNLLTQDETSLLEERTLTQGNFVRSFWVKTPKNHDGRALEPLLLLLHDSDGDGAQILRRHGWRGQSDSGGFFIVAPDALPRDPSQRAGLQNPRLWNAGSRETTASQAILPEDVAYLKAVLDDVRSAFPIDPRRVYVAGLGEGGSMALRMAAEAPRAFAASATIAGALQVPVRKMPYPIAIMMITGGKDPFLPMAGGPVALPWGENIQRAAPALTFEIWGQALGCRSNPKKVRTHWRDIWLTQMRRCTKRAVVRWFQIDLMGHHWPGGDQSRWGEAVVGPYAVDPNATSLVWNFFTRHVKSWK